MRFKNVSKPQNHIRLLRGLLILGVIAITGCQPSDRTPGLWLRGKVAEGFPSDWKFSDEYREIYVQVATPYLLPHSVTIWCAQVDGDLFIGARNPESKKWPGWADKNSDVVLKIGDFLYDARLQAVEDANEISQIRLAYAEKYRLSTAPGESPPAMRYWRVMTP